MGKTVIHPIFGARNAERGSSTAHGALSERTSEPVAKKFDAEELHKLTTENIEADPAGPKAPLLAKIQLLIALTYLLEVAKSERSDGTAFTACGLVEKAINLLDKYPAPPED